MNKDTPDNSNNFLGFFVSAVVKKQLSHFVPNCLNPLVVKNVCCSCLKHAGAAEMLKAEITDSRHNTPQR